MASFVQLEGGQCKLDVDSVFLHLNEDAPRLGPPCLKSKSLRHPPYVPRPFDLPRLRPAEFDSESDTASTVSEPPQVADFSEYSPLSLQIQCYPSSSDSGSRPSHEKDWDTPDISPLRQTVKRVRLILPAPPPGWVDKHMRRCRTTIESLSNKECRLCGKKFNCSTHARRHESSNIHQDDANGCRCHIPGCGRLFATRRQVQNHLADPIHAKDRPFACRYTGCDKAYFRKEHLYRHTSNVHRR